MHSFSQFFLWHSRYQIVILNVSICDSNDNLYEWRNPASVLLVSGKKELKETAFNYTDNGLKS